MDNKKKLGIELVFYFITSIILVITGNLAISYAYINELPYKEYINLIIYFINVGLIFFTLMLFKDKERNLGFEKDKLPIQIIYGLLLSGGMVAIFKLLGNSCVGQHFKINKAMLFALLSAIFAGFSEELAYRGLILTRVKKITNSNIAAIFISSIIFGVSHFTRGDMDYMIMTSITGVLLATSRLYLKSCTLLSTTTAHVLYNFAMSYIAF